jgi:AraC-like DNA-binding protein
MGYFNIESKRNISLANQNIYTTGSQHPDRIMHEHDLVYILEGSWEICQNNELYTLFPDDIIILHANQHHYGLKPCEPKTRTMFIHVNCDPSDLFEIDGSKYLPDLLVKLDTVIHCHSNENVKRLFKDIISTYWSDNTKKEYKANSLFQLLLIELADCNNSTVQSQLIEKAFRIMQNNPNKIFKVDDLASQLFVSGKTLRNKFSSVYQKTFTQYQMEMKLKKACVLLHEYPEMPLSEVARNLGFYDEFHFSKVFKKNYGLSPNLYKKKSDFDKFC